jgi:hypothetical protein
LVVGVAGERIERDSSGLALTNDSSGFADMRVWLDESRC